MTLRRALTVGAIALAMGAVTLVALYPGDARTRLDTALRQANQRPFRARLAGLAYARPPRLTRSAATQPPDDTLRLRAVAGDIATSSANDDHIRGVAALFANDVDGALKWLETVAARDANNASAWSDVAAALFVKAEGNASVLCSALAAADRALAIMPGHADAQFNRAVILETLALREAAADAYADYLRLDGTSDWANEARERLQGLKSETTRTTEWTGQKELLERAAANKNQKLVQEIVSAYPQESRTWAEAEFLGEWGARVSSDSASADAMLSLSRFVGAALREHNGEALLADAVAAIDDAQRINDRARVAALAAAHAAYRDGRKLYGGRKVVAARGKLIDAQRRFDSEQSPFGLLAAYYMANVEVDAGQRRNAILALTKLSERVPARYRALLAQMSWLRGTIAGKDGLFELALTSYEDATNSFLQLGEQQNAIETRARAGALLALLGRTSEAWEQRGELFRLASATGSAWRLERVLYSAVLDTIREERWDVASSLLLLMTEIDSGNPRMHAESLVWRPLVAHRAGMTQIVQPALADARLASATMNDSGLREEVTNELRLVEALLICDEDPGRSIDLLRTYIAVAESGGRTAFLPQVLIERARLFRKTGRLALAEKDLYAAIAAVEHTHAAIERADLRDSFMGKSSEAYDALAEVLDTRRDWIGAIAASDRRRGRAIIDGIDAATVEALAPDKIASRLPPRTAILTYGAFEDRTVAYTISARGISRSAVATTNAELKALVNQHAHAIATGDSESSRSSGSRLFQILVEPALDEAAAVDTLIFITEKTTENLPFATLVQRDGQFLIESYVVAVAPSVEWYARSASRAVPATGTSILSVGGPRLDALRFPDLIPLRGAESEARTIGALYPTRSVLVGDEATKARFTAGLGHCDTVHIATHALADPIDPRSSRFLFAGQTDAELTTRELSAMHLDGVRVAVLAGCQTAVSTTGYGDVRSLAAGLLAAGVQSVVASLWDIDDETTRDLSIDVHRELRAGNAPAQALRNAQLRMLRNPNPRLRDSRVWAALQLYGSGR